MTGEAVQVIDLPDARKSAVPKPAVQSLFSPCTSHRFLPLRSSPAASMSRRVGRIGGAEWLRG
jgi:hypothetical protein